MLRTRVGRIAGASALGVAVGTAAASLGRPFNYSIFPEAPHAVQSRIAAAALTIEHAIAKAKEAVGGGVIKSAEFYLPPRPERPADPDGPQSQPQQDIEPDEIEVLLYHEGAAYRVVFDAATGRITEQRRVPRFFGWEVEGDYTEMSNYVRYYVIEEGQGDGPALDEDDAALATVVGYLADGTLFWDTRGNPDGKMTLQMRQAVPGLQSALAGVREGAKRKIIVPYTQGYGLFGSPPHVPSNATLIFDVEVHSVHKLTADGELESEAAKKANRPDIPPPPPPPPGKRVPSPKPPPAEEKPGEKPPGR